MAQLPMFDDQADNLKRYYSISEVAKMFKISTSQIRLWEKEFESLKPSKNTKGERRFTKKNIEQLKTIHNLLKVRGFTHDGAKREFKRRKSAGKEKLVIIKKLESVKDFLEGLKKEI